MDIELYRFWGFRAKDTESMVRYHYHLWGRAICEQNTRPGIKKGMQGTRGVMK